MLQIQYSAVSCDDYNVGGAQCYAMWNASGSVFQSMLVTNEAAFDAGLTRALFSGAFRLMESTRQGKKTHWREIVEYVTLCSVVE